MSFIYIVDFLKERVNSLQNMVVVPLPLYQLLKPNPVTSVLIFQLTSFLLRMDKSSYKLIYSTLVKDRLSIAVFLFPVSVVMRSLKLQSKSLVL